MPHGRVDAYVMHRVFCASPGDLERERDAFYQVMADLNEQEAMPGGILFVSVSIPATTLDKRPFQAALSENIRACRYYIQLLEDSWGPPEKNFERDYVLATRCAGDPVLPMQEVAVLFKRPLAPDQVDPRVVEFKRTLGHYLDFTDLDEFRIKLRAQLSAWLKTVIV